MFNGKSENFDNWLSSPSDILDNGMTGCLSPRNSPLLVMTTTTSSTSVSSFSFEPQTTKQAEWPFQEATLMQAPMIEAPQALLVKPRAAPSKKEKIAGRPVTGIPYDQREYLSALEGRTVFRAFAKIMKSFRSETWARLSNTCPEVELAYLRNLFSDAACTYSYTKKGDKREVGERATSLISRLCYKINKNVQHEYLMDPLLTQAFLKARPEIIEHFTTAFARDKADAVVQKFADLCEKYEAEQHPSAYGQAY